MLETYFVKPQIAGAGRLRGAVRVLRYAYRQGLLAADLSKAVEWPPAYRLADIPRSISWAEVGRVLGAVDRRTPCGKRDYAMPLLLVTYGMRAREVAALTLDDIDWKRDRLAVPGRKTGHSIAFPLSAVVGEALVGYLRPGRPPPAAGMCSSGRWRRSGPSPWWRSPPAGRSQPAVRGIRRPRLDPGGAMTQTQPPGPVLHSFFASHLITVKGLRPASARSYRDTVRLFLVLIAADRGCKITRLTFGDLTFGRVVAFLRHLEHDRGNHPRTRNQRLAALHCLFDYIAGREPGMLATCQQVAAIPARRAAPPETRLLERDEIEDLLRHLPRDGPLTLRDPPPRSRVVAGPIVHVSVMRPIGPAGHGPSTLCCGQVPVLGRGSVARVDLDRRSRRREAAPGLQVHQLSGRAGRGRRVDDPLL